jgi:CheY-like chemotaxis protein
MQVKPLKILLVEDNESEAHQVLEAINNHNPDHVVSVLNDGIGVIKYLEDISHSQNKSFPDIILLDLNLPKHNGRKVITDLKSHPDLKTAPIIVLTISDFEEDIRNSYRDKISSYIVKPESNDELEKIISSAMDFYSITQIPNNNHTK